MHSEKLFYFISLFVTAATGSDLSQYAVDIGRNLSLPCSVQNDRDVMWIREGREDEQISRLSIQDDGSLFLMEVDKNDSGIYACSPVNIVNEDLMKSRMQVLVRTPPPLLVNVTVRPSTILALILWAVNGTGGYPIIHFTAEYKLAYVDNEWIPISPNHISPNSRQLEIYKLEPNTSYAFRIWAVNQLGKGEITELISRTIYHDEEGELVRHLLEGADKFDTRIWVVAVCIVMGTLVLLGFGTCFLLYQECRTPGVSDEQEIIELVPNIILNPGFEGNSHTELIPADENSNSESTFRLNNNTVVQPRNV